MKKWATLIGFSFINFSNGIGFGIYTSNLSDFATYFSTTQLALQNTFYIGLVVEVLFCIPAIKLIEWRFDYAIISAAYLTACANLLQYFCIGNIVIVIAALTLNSIAQLFVLPIPLYLAQLWFQLEKRPFTIGICFYANLLGFGLGGTLSSMQSFGIITVSQIILVAAYCSSTSLLLGMILVNNKPKIRIQSKKKVEWRNIRDLWKQKYTAYNVVMVSVFLGVSWTFLSQFSTLSSQFPNQAVYLNIAWIVSGASFGLCMSWFIQKWLSKTGNFKYYDYTCKIILFVGICGNLGLGILVYNSYEEFWAYILAVILIGIGTIGFLGITMTSLVESLYPVPALLIGTMIALFASIYSILSLALSQVYPNINSYFSVAAVTFVPWFYYSLTFKTSFKRYKYYLNQKQSKFQLLKIYDVVSQKGQD